MGIQSKLLLMLLAVSLLASGVIGTIGYVNGRDSLRESAFEQLTTVRELRTEEIERELAAIQLGVKLDSRNQSAVQAATAFVDGFEALQQSTLTPQQDDELEAFYRDQFVPALEERAGEDYDPAAFVPVTPAGRYLQTYYTAGRDYEDFDAALDLSDAGDGSAWSAANAEYGSYFTELVRDLGYEDILVLNPEADVVYSAYKSVDLGVNIQAEPYTNSALTSAFETSLSSGSLDIVTTTDFERYLPSLNVPAAWVLSPIGSATDIVGVLAVQIPIERINATMSGAQSWASQGLGATGEVYLAGPDLLMRSASRLLAEDPDSYAARVTANGTPPTTAERIAEVRGTVLLQQVDYPAVQRALRGETGTAIARDYLGTDTLVAYAPLEIDGLDWVIVASIQSSEAFAAIDTFTRSLLLSTLGILVLVSIASLLIAQIFTRPLNQLVGAVRRVAAGDLSVQVPRRSQDEFGDLGGAFNEMAASLRAKQELIDEQRAENEHLLLTLMPEAMAQRYKKGEEAISEEHDNVTVVFAEIIGFDDYARTLAGADEIAKLNELMRGFDEASASTGVEKVRALRNGYLASSGLIVPRVDNARRAVDFAHAMRASVQRFNARHDAALDLRAGVDTGTVTSGLVARTSLAYDLWGDAVNLAYRVGAVAAEAGVFVSDAVRERLADSVSATRVGTIELRGTEQVVWRVEEA